MSNNSNQDSTSARPITVHDHPQMVASRIERTISAHSSAAGSHIDVATSELDSHSNKSLSLAQLRALHHSITAHMALVDASVALAQVEFDAVDVSAFVSSAVEKFAGRGLSERRLTFFITEMKGAVAG